MQIDKVQNEEVVQKRSRRLMNSNDNEPSTRTVALVGISMQKPFKQVIIQQTLSSKSSRSTLDSDHPKQIGITEQISLMIAKYLKPFSVVEDLGFKAVMKVAEPRYVMPSRKTMSADTIPELYKKTVAEVKFEVCTASALAVTTDACTSRAHRGYLSYTAHFMTSQVTSMTYCLKVEHSDDSHTAVNLAKSLSGCIDEWTTEQQ
jgi:actin-related protein